jgi:diguanylate cyclase (GGDEF)-like protein
VTVSLPVDAQFSPVIHAATGRLAGVELHLEPSAAAEVVSAAIAAALVVSAGKLFLPAKQVRLIGEPALQALVQESGIDPARLCVEYTAGSRRTADLPARWINIDLDAQGGITGLGMLREAMPQVIRLSPALCRGLHTDIARRSMLAAIAHLARELGSLSIATGIADPRDFYLARDAGCSLVSGPAVHPAMVQPEAISDPAPAVLELLAGDRRRRREGQANIGEVLDLLPTVHPQTPIDQILAIFRQAPDMHALPVVDADGLPLGLIPEARVKAYAYSQFGQEILRNRALGKRVADLMEPCPVADINTPLSELLDRHAGGRARFGVLITEALRYRGLLSSAALLTLVAERRVQQARDENPLSQLPGNRSIDDSIAAVLADNTRTCTLVYFDFDHFKPFNDVFGFRQGDRAILMFADLMRSAIVGDGSFVGHIGGDDFFAIVPATATEADMVVTHMIARFSDSVSSFFDEPTRQQGTYRARDRDGNERDFPLLRVSAVLLPLRAGRVPISPDDIASALAKEKKRAKAAPNGIAIVG